LNRGHPPKSLAAIFWKEVSRYCLRKKAASKRALNYLLKDFQEAYSSNFLLPQRD